MKVKNSNFVDYVKIFCRSGKGGAGSVHLLRDRTTAKGGPDGGDGGRGGHIIIKGNEQMWTLLHLKYQKHIFAEHGGAGSGNNKIGKDGESRIWKFLWELLPKMLKRVKCFLKSQHMAKNKSCWKAVKEEEEMYTFKSPTNQTPRYAQPGITSKEGWFILELKVLADVGLVGFPNAEKSTLLSVVSAAKPEIANYPFTTLVPNLGIVSYRDHKSFIMADIPGIIEGAAEGRGLGLRFLRHIERNSTLLFMVPSDSDNIKKEYEILLERIRKIQS